MINSSLRKLFHAAWLGLLYGSLSLTANASPAVTDRDHDGIHDIEDRCPDTPPLRKLDPGSRLAPLFGKEYFSAEPVSVAVDSSGCAMDSDGDSIPDHQDYCPEDTPVEISAGVNRNGCPLQSDQDGTPDYRDACPDTPRGVPADRHGCPVLLQLSSSPPASPGM